MKKIFLLTLAFFALFAGPESFAAKAPAKTSETVTLANGRSIFVDFYGPRTVRIFYDPLGRIIRDPEATPQAKILQDNPRVSPGKISSSDNGSLRIITNGTITVRIDTGDGRFTVSDGRDRFRLRAPVDFTGKGFTIRAGSSPSEQFYGGGVQNGRYSHKGKSILIENLNSWTDGGVASPAPFFWAKNSYGVLFHTFRKGVYDFRSPNEITLSHEDDYLDMFIFTGDTPSEILRAYYALTGKPVLMPRFGFYEGHLNAYNRDWWAESKDGILFEDGKRYKESQSDNGGLRESLNGTTVDDYQFSARAVVDRYRKWDFPLGWVLPNDGYACGYGQSSTLGGNINNLRRFGDYTRSKGVEIGLWTQSDLYPVDTLAPLLQRDLEAEVGDGGVRVLKTDVAWVAPGYSFGLNGITRAAEIITRKSGGARPFIISVDGWAGTQRYAGIWTGDQKGGEWEYIRFHIPTYIGSGLSGQPNITSDTDGIFGGGNEFVNIREFQWKTFTPMQMNMDGWGSNPKYPHALGERAAVINRKFLKLKSELIPYQYSIARTAVNGLPMIRAMFLEFPDEKADDNLLRYQYMFGPWILVAPVYKETDIKADGDDIRDGIYLPKGLWADFFTGETLEGGRVINNYPAPLDRIPVFIREGAIIPMAQPHNNPSEQNRRLRIYRLFPGDGTTFSEYDDDGSSVKYLENEFSRTHLGLSRDRDKVTFLIGKTQGTFSGMERMKATLVRMLATRVSSVEARIDDRKIRLVAATSPEQFEDLENAWIIERKELKVKLKEIDITKSSLSISVTGYAYDNPFSAASGKGRLEPPSFTPVAKDIAPTSITLRWNAPSNADYSEIEFNSQLYSNLRNSFTFDGLSPDTGYEFKLRSVNSEGVSSWVLTQMKTAPDPLENAIRGISASCSAPSQNGQGTERLFDLDTEGEMWHTKWSEKATPFQLQLDLGAVWTLERMEYIPRRDAGNGTFVSGRISWSSDAASWSAPVPFNWEISSSAKVFSFNGTPNARFIRIDVDRANGDFGSGQEILLFKVPGTGSFKGGVFNEKGEAVEHL